MQWDLFCRVIDNHGDIGVCWRLAADLADRGQQVRLWVDDASALAWMAPTGATGVSVQPWPSARASLEPGDVAIEAFGCELPEWFVCKMATAARPPVWINLEYLSAEDFVERSHRLPSPQSSGPGAGLRKWFFYPGFTKRTGGLIRERDLSPRQQVFEACEWRAAHGASAIGGEQVVSLFCYAQPALPALLDALAQQPTLMLATAGQAAQQVSALLGDTLQRGALRAVLLPALSQREYDHLLWASDLNFVRGEDSFVRAQWAGKPFVWQIYPQDDGAHLTKLDAFLSRFAGTDDALPAIGGLFRHWNGGPSAASHGSPLGSLLGAPKAPDRARWQQRCLDWRATLQAQADLSTQLLGFVAETG